MQPKKIIKINNYINSIEAHLILKDELNEKVSKAPVGWHLDHSLKVINGVIKTMEASDPKAYKNNFSFMGRFFLSLGTFPRGKARAPKSVIPPEVITTDALKDQLEEAKAGITKIHDLNENAFFKHPLFGNINKRRIERFLEIHTNHHLKIVKNILK